MSGQGETINKMTIIQKPTFKETIGITTIDLPEFNLQFNARRVGLMTYAGLRQADYGQDFQMPTMSQLIPLVYASSANRNKETAKNVVQTLRPSWLTGNTVVHYLPEGMFVEDNPKMKKGRIVIPSKKALESRLGKNQEGDVTFSDDGSLRFTPYSFKRDSQTASALAKNSGVIAFAGSLEGAEMLAKSSKYHYNQNLYFWALLNVKEPQTRVAGLLSDGFDGGLAVDADGDEIGNYRCSFGVLDLKQGVKK